MRCASQPTGIRQTIGLDRVHRIVTAIAMTLAIVMMMPATSGFAQTPTPAASPRPRPSPTPTPSPSPTSTNVDQSAGNGTLNLGSNFLERLGNQASSGINRASRTNAGGGGASESAEDPRYRTWYEGYGISVRTDAQGDFVGDKRKTFGGVAGFGARIVPDVNLGFSVDQRDRKSVV